MILRLAPLRWVEILTFAPRKMRKYPDPPPLTKIASAPYKGHGKGGWRKTINRKDENTTDKMKSIAISN